MKYLPGTPAPGSPTPGPSSLVADPADRPSGAVLRLQRIGPGADLPPAATMLRLLDDVERARAARIADATPSALFVAGRYLLRTLVADLLGTQAGSLVSCFECPICDPHRVSDHGRPAYLLRGERVPLALSLSRANGFVLLGVLGAAEIHETVELSGRGGTSGSAASHGIHGPEGTATTVGANGTPLLGGVGSKARPGLGVDLTAVAAVDFGGFDDVALTPEERTMVDGLPSGDRRAVRARLWARKEALVKASGMGFTDRGPDAVGVLEEPRVTDLSSIDGEPLEPLGFVAAVAVDP
ncbi:4'-phosphopantetheinyl transferase family protein [Arthrobacter sp. TMS2-4]